MSPLTTLTLPRDFSPEGTSAAFSSQWTNPSDAFSVLLIVGGDTVARALAQLTGSVVAPVAFSFGWVAYAVTAVISAIGEKRLMPLPDCACIVINGRTGYIRTNYSWIIGRIVRDYENWMDSDIKKRVQWIIEERWKSDKEKAEAREPGSGRKVQKPTQAGLCVSVYTACYARSGYSGRDWIYYLGFFTSIVQLGIASIPCGIYGDWGILMITASGIALSFVAGSLPQWKREKWACRQETEKTVILTRGNGSQHAIVIIGDKNGLDFEDLAMGPITANVSASLSTIALLIVLAVLWILLLITVSGLRHHTWFLLAIGLIGMIQNVVATGIGRSPENFGIPLEYNRVFAEPKVMDTLFAVEDSFHRVGRSMLETFFPGPLRPEENKRWEEYERRADRLDRQSR
ncbi:hypothetical protein DPV78_005821 [Talaromyces pinophilus]|nr:hypothetical protein DPV78_005821 [Talaromyces pinophilus]